MKQLIIASLIIIVSTSCATKLQTALSTDSRKKWMVIELNGEPVAASDNTERSAHLVFNTAENRFAGSSSCNRVMGTYTIGEANAFSFGPIAGTLMACSNNTIENKLLEAMKTVNKAFIKNNQLLLMKNDTVIIKLQ